MLQSKSVVIVDDHPLFREGLKAIINLDDRFELVGEAGDCREAIRVAKEVKPDLMAVDVSLPDMSGIQLTREIQAVLPDTQILIVSVHSRVDYISEAFQAGAKGYMVKESASERLLQGLATIGKGEFFLDSSISCEVVRGLMRIPAREATITDAAYDILTSREQEILRLLAEGLGTKEIADRLSISPKTVENHRSNIMNKLELNSVVELVRYAARLGLIDIDLWKE